MSVRGRERRDCYYGGAAPRPRSTRDDYDCPNTGSSAVMQPQATMSVGRRAPRAWLFNYKCAR